LAAKQSFWNVYAAVFVEVMLDESNAAGKNVLLPEFGTPCTA
jgi:hypothetical protein